MSRGRIVLASFVVILVFGLAIALRPRRAAGGGERGPFPSPREPSAGAAGAVEPSAAYDGSALAHTIADRKIRDDLRRRILAAWAAEGAAAESAAPQPMAPMPPMPTRADGTIDPAYIQQVIRQDMFPMAKQCYEELLTRRP